MFFGYVFNKVAAAEENLRSKMEMYEQCSTNSNRVEWSKAQAELS